VSTNLPRAVFVVRETELQLLNARHATREQSRFFLRSRGQTLDAVEQRNRKFEEALHLCRSVVPTDWRQTLVRRADFDRFLFAPEDIIIAVGQDGLVANVAKYLDGQPVFGVNPDPQNIDGVLVRVAPAEFEAALTNWRNGSIGLEARTMVKAELDDGASLLALNEIFIGHASHQSARYQIDFADQRETQSSSGLIVSSGTGATGWARSIMEATSLNTPLAPTDRQLGFFVREPFPSVSTGTSLRAGLVVNSRPLKITSRMNEGGTIFADGIEKDRLTFDWGRIVTVSIADKRLNLAAV
jgi:hypothetical protein